MSRKRDARFAAVAATAMALYAPSALAQEPRGGFGYGGYDGGYYDPYDPERSYPDPAEHAGRRYEEGTLRLQVKPKEAAVYIDGYYTGVVDDFDGAQQLLRIEARPHRIELRDPRYQTLTFTVKIEPNRTTTYRGKMKKTK